MTHTTVKGGYDWSAQPNRDPRDDIRELIESERRKTWQPGSLVMTPNQVRALRASAYRWGHEPISFRWRIIKECNAILRESGVE